MTINLPEAVITAIIAKLETFGRFSDHRDAIDLEEALLDAYLCAEVHGERGAK